MSDANNLISTRHGENVHSLSKKGNFKSCYKFHQMTTAMKTSGTKEGKFVTKYACKTCLPSSEKVFICQIHTMKKSLRKRIS
jgi:hypothetical protein